jgi:hypothetical protein
MNQMKTSRWIFGENLRSVVLWMDRWEELRLESFPDFIDYLDSLCICRGSRGAASGDCDPLSCQRQYRAGS